MIENITKLPLVIISSPRTGSNGLAMLLQEKLQGNLFIEPGTDAKKLSDFLRYASLNKNFILKEHAEVLLSRYKNFNIDDCCVVSITRKNIVEQVLSSYIAVKRKKWFYDPSETDYQNDTIDMDDNHLKQTIEFVNKHNLSIEKFKDKIDFHIVYEDIVDKLNIGIKTIQPKNYDELLIWAKEIYGET
jgi:hypothetical protein